MKRPPHVKSMLLVGGAPLSDRHRWELYKQVKSDGDAQYSHVLAVIDRNDTRVCFIASELNGTPDPRGNGSYSLVVFDRNGYTNRGTSNDWGVPKRFFDEALRIALETFGGHQQTAHVPRPDPLSIAAEDAPVVAVASNQEASEERSTDEPLPDVTRRTRGHFAEYASPKWRPPAGLADRKPGMAWSDRLWHWLVSLGGLAIVAGGVAWVAFSPIGKKLGILLICMGFVVFFLGFPSRAQRNGYRE